MAWLLLACLVVTQVIAIDHVEQGLLAADDGEVGMWSGLVGKKYGAA